MNFQKTDGESYKKGKKRGSVMKKAPALRSPGRPVGSKDVKKRRKVVKKVVKPAK